VVDVFEEVEEQLRTERYMAMAKRVLPWAIGLGVLLVVVAVGVWGWDAWRTSAQNKASTTLSQALKAQSENATSTAFTQLGEVAKTGTPVYKTLALMQQGGMRLEAGSVAEAVGFFDNAAKVSPDAALADWASMRSVYALFDTAPYAELEKRLTPLAGDKRPFRLEAKEGLAFLKLRDGKVKEARTDFVVLSQIFDATPGMRNRAKAAISLIDSGGAPDMAKAAKMAAEAPPPPAGLPPGMQLPPGAGGPGPGPAE
jgi:hypothetical protein